MDYNLNTVARRTEGTISIDFSAGQTFGVGNILSEYGFRIAIGYYSQESNTYTMMAELYFPARYWSERYVGPLAIVVCDVHRDIYTITPLVSLVLNPGAGGGGGGGGEPPALIPVPITDPGWDFANYGGYNLYPWYDDGDGWLMANGLPVGDLTNGLPVGDYTDVWIILPALTEVRFDCALLGYVDSLYVLVDNQWVWDVAGPVSGTYTVAIGATGAPRIITWRYYKTDVGPGYAKITNIHYRPEA